MINKYISDKIITRNLKNYLIFHCFRIYIKILRSCLKTFGFGGLFFYYLYKVPLKLLYTHFFLFLDNIFFPKYRKIKIQNPVFIIGHPRSATTFFHEILRQASDFLVFQKWELVHPSLTERSFLSHSKFFLTVHSILISELSFTPHLVKTIITAPKNIRKEKVQNQNKKLESIAKEEELLFLHTLDTQFLSIETPLGFEKKGYPELCFNDDQPHEAMSVKFLKGCFKRQSYRTGNKQIIAKMNFSLFRVKTLLKIFPDAKFIYIARSPLETIPSHLSLHRGIIDRCFGLDNIPADKLQQYFKNRYQYNIEFYKHFEALKKNNVIPEDRLLEISYDEIKNDLWEVVERTKNFGELEFTHELEKNLKKQSNAQSDYKRKHKNFPLEQFNLTEEKIRSDFDFVFKRYGFK